MFQLCVLYLSISLTSPLDIWTQASELSPPHIFHSLHIVWSIWDELWIIFIWGHCTTSQDWCVCPRYARQMQQDVTDVRRLEQTERRPERICREFLVFSLCCCSGCFTNPTCVYLMTWEWDSTSTIFVVRLGTPGTLSQCGLFPPLMFMLVMCHMHICILG